MLDATDNAWPIFIHILHLYKSIHKVAQIRHLFD